jgi:hypothetical protein
LDVLSCQRDHAALSHFLGLIDQLLLIPNVTVVVACREFDLKYDSLLRDRKWDAKIRLKDFDYTETVLPILKVLQVDENQINDDLKGLLCLPQNLSLFESLTKYEEIFHVRTTYELYNAFIEYTLKQDPDLDDEVFEKINQLVSKLLKEREHSTSKNSLNIKEDLLQKLISKGVLNQEQNGKIGFSHQTLLDNFVANQALQKGISLFDLILNHPPLPFYRPAVRSYLFFLRGQSQKVFSQQVRKTLINENVAYHFKRLIIETYAEMIPTDDDWNLVRWMFRNQEELFKRFFWSLKSECWFDIIANKWYPFLESAPNKTAWYTAFLSKLATWMNTFPEETVRIWNNALKTTWGKNNLWYICTNLVKFEHYQLEEIKSLILYLKNQNVDKHYWLGEIYCNYIHATGKGYDILWTWIIRDIKRVSFHHTETKSKLHCEGHKLRKGNFLEEHLCKSYDFLNLVLNTLQDWINESNYLEEGKLTCSFLEYTSLPDNVHRSSSLYIENLSVFISALENAILYHVKIKSNWWIENEGWLQNSTEIGFRYILVKAYLEDIESNLDGITTQLCDEKLIESDEINYELGILLSKSFLLLSESTQNRVINLIENLFSNSNESEERFVLWQNRIKLELYLRIPMFKRTQRVQEIINSNKIISPSEELQRRTYTFDGYQRVPITPENLRSYNKQEVINFLDYCNS